MQGSSEIEESHTMSVTSEGTMAWAEGWRSQGGRLSSTSYNTEATLRK